MTDDDEDDDDSVEAAENKDGTADGTSCCLLKRNIIYCTQHVGMRPMATDSLCYRSGGRHFISLSPAVVSPVTHADAAELAC
jgi:hypothetical protein